MLGIENSEKVPEVTYLSCWDHDTNLLNGLGELIRLNSSVVVQIEVLESLKQNCLFVGVAGRLLGQLLLEALLKAAEMKRKK